MVQTIETWNPNIDMDLPIPWRKPRRILINSPEDHEVIDRMFAVAAIYPQHTFMILTDPEQMADYFASRSWGDIIADGRSAYLRVPIGHRGQGPLYDLGAAYSCEDRAAELAETKEWAKKAFEAIGGRRLPQSWPIPNCWLGTIVEDQKTADERIPHLLALPAAVRFIFAEPVGLIDISPPSLRGSGNWLGPASQSRGMHNGIEWVIVSGESGKHARPCNVEWIRSIVQQCKDAGVPVFVKQLGSWPVSRANPYDSDPSEWPADLCVREWPERDIGHTSRPPESASAERL